MCAIVNGFFVAGPKIQEAGSTHAAAKKLLKKETREAIIKWSWRIAPFLYIIAVIRAFVYVTPAPANHAPDNDLVARFILGGLIALAPPVYFFMESVWFYGPGFVNDAYYKANQELASKVWIAVSAVLFAYWSGKAGG